MPPVACTPSSSNTAILSSGLQSSSPLKLLKNVIGSSSVGNVSLSMETMQRSVANAFALKYSQCIH